MQESQRNKILRILSDFRPHCLAHEMQWIKDDRSRCSELRKLGYRFNESIGNCVNPTHNHVAGLKLRQIIGNPLGSDIRPPYKEPATDHKQTAKSFDADAWINQWKKPEQVKSNTATLW